RPGAVLELRAERCRGPCLHRHEEDLVTGDGPDRVADVERELAEQIGNILQARVDGDEVSYRAGVDCRVPQEPLAARGKRDESRAIPAERGDRDGPRGHVSVE